MHRRNFMRDVVLGIAASLLPKILQPTIPEVAEEESKPDTFYVGYFTGEYNFNGEFTLKEPNPRYTVYTYHKQYNKWQKKNIP